MFTPGRYLPRSPTGSQSFSTGCPLRQHVVLIQMSWKTLHSRSTQPRRVQPCWTTEALQHQGASSHLQEETCAWKQSQLCWLHGSTLNGR